MLWFVSTPAVAGNGGGAGRRGTGPGRWGRARLRVLLVGVLFVGAGLGGFIVTVTAYAESLGVEFVGRLVAGAQGIGALIGGLYWSPSSPYRTIHAGCPSSRRSLAAGYLPLLIQPTPAAVLALVAILAGSVCRRC